MRSDLLDYAGCAFPVEGLGPGRRIAMWVRGCERRCVGCIAPELWEPGEGTPIASIIEEMLPYLADADGLTISGGEPFRQAGALAAFLDRLRARRDLEVLIYTGYTLDELRGGSEEARALLQRTDLLIDGPFMDSSPNTLQWRGSDNQRIYLLSERAQRYAGGNEAQMPAARPLQVQMLAPTRYRIIGIPRRGDLATYRAAMAERGFEVSTGE